MNLIDQLAVYLTDVGSGRGRLELCPDAGEKLPLFLSHAYSVYRATIFEKTYMLLVASTTERPTPAAAVKHIDIARRALGASAAFVFAEMPSFERKRYVEKQVPFIVPGRQVFLPMVLVDLRERGGQARLVQGAAAGTLSSPAQALLLYYLQRDNTRSWSLTDWAERLRYSASTMTRVRAEFASNALCREMGEQRSLIFVFPEDRRALWEQSQHLLASPVRDKRHVVVQSGAEWVLLRAGLTALSDRTMLAAPAERVYAIASQKYGALVREQAVEETPVAVEDSITIERWKYDPLPLSPDGERVDALSLALCLRDDPDERVQGARDAMLEDLPW